MFNFFERKASFRPHDVVTMLDVGANPLRMIVRDVRGDMCEVAPFNEQGTGTTVWVNKMLLLKQRN